MSYELDIPADRDLVCTYKDPSGQVAYISPIDNDDQDGTYTLQLRASEPGLHTVNVEKDGEPIQGSPFFVNVTQAPDAKKVRAFGPGLNDSKLGEYDGNFYIDLKGAGPGELRLRAQGPKGAFQVDMERQDARKVAGVLNVNEAGLYTLNVFWSGEHISGSPFTIQVLP